MYRALTERLAEGATVVTPNRRLATAVRHAFDLRARERGLASWPAADAVPWNAWVERIYRDALLRGGAGRLILSTQQAQLLWRRVVAESPEGESLLHVDSTGDIAREAWDLAHAWRLLPALQSMPLPEETRAFLRWSRDYDSLCNRERFSDFARLPDQLSDLAGAGALALPARLVLFGFDRLDLQKQALLQALRAGGVAVELLEPERRDSVVVRLGHANSEEEIRAAALWARNRLASAPDSRIGVVVPDLARVRPLLARTFDEVLVPFASADPAAGRVRPWNMSLGQPLSQWPLVHAALLMLDLATGPIGLARAGALLRSPFLTGANSEYAARALLDVRLRRLGDPHVTLDQLIFHASLEGHAYTCGVLAERLALMRQRLRALPAGAQPTSLWGPALQSLLAALGWPGERELNSEEYQTFVKWRELVAGLSRFDFVSPALSFAAAVRLLHRLATDQLFQPETPEVPIQVLGLLESAQLEFDHLFVLGLTDEAWPRAARANALLPANLQRARGVPGGSAEWELGFARRMQAAWRSAAPSVVFSYHVSEGDRTLARSPLLAEVPETTLDALGVEAVTPWRAAIHASAIVEQIPDWRGRALPEGVAFGGGARLVRNQSACPFRAFAVHRLGAEGLEHPRQGLDARARGALLHEVLAGLWSELRSHQRLIDLDPQARAALVERCVSSVLERVQPRRPSVFQTRFFQLEQERLRALLLEWLEVEREREPFEVVEYEQASDIEVGGVQLRLRLDRVDRLAAGGEVLIDYKTGRLAPTRWLGERPDEPQLPLYTLARAEPPRALALAQVRRGECGFAGWADRAGVAPGVLPLAKPSTGGYADWPAFLAALRAQVDALARAFRSGAAAVDPKQRTTTCRQCDLAALCRVNEVVDRGTPAVVGEEEDGADA